MTKHTGNQTEETKVEDDIRQLVLARVRAIPKNVRVSIGAGDYTTEQLLESVEQGNEVGKEIIENQMEYLRDLASGAIYGDE